MNNSPTTLKAILQIPPKLNVNFVLWSQQMGILDMSK